MNESDSQVLHPLKVRGCSSIDCPWDEFVAGIEPFIPNDWEKECTSGTTILVLTLFPILFSFFNLFFGQVLFV